jgi:secondary thiamine-phosphate synthase enzyme
MTKTLNISSKSRNEFIDITAEVARIVKQSGIRDGVCYIFVPHTTAGITINEGADPSVKRDILAALKKVFPHEGDYAHTEGNSDAHIKASLTGSTAVTIIENGALILGTWQAIFFCEYDGPRNRKIIIKIV